MRHERNRESQSVVNQWAWSAHVVSNLPHIHAEIGPAETAQSTPQRCGLPIPGTAQRVGQKTLVRILSESISALNRHQQQTRVA
jgi:hypothetical protein